MPDATVIRTEKERLLEYLQAPTTTNARNSMGCSENWYDPFFAMKETFSKTEIEAMSNDEICRLLRLAQNIADGLY